MAGAAALLAAGAVLIRAALEDHRSDQPVRAVAPPVVPRGALSTVEEITMALFEAVSPSVVFIQTAAFRRDLFSLNVLQIPRGSGSGFVWDEDGHIVTNFHVIEGAQRALVTLSDQTMWEAELIGAEADKDLAVLRIDAPNHQLRPIPIGSSSDLRVGQSVLAIGNPFGLDQTLTTGVVSGLGREIKATTGRIIKGVIQTDAAINPGNSGGPLLDSTGRVIGINTAIVGPSGASAGVGFAVPVDAIRRIIPQLIQFGVVRRPILGISLVDDSMRQRLRLEGALVASVAPGSGAERAGLQPTVLDRQGRLMAELIVALEGHPIRRNDDLLDAIEKHRPGDRITVTVRRGSRTFDLDVVLSESLN
jgi:S1-C subfamily serine protease